MFEISQDSEVLPKPAEGIQTVYKCTFPTDWPLSEATSNQSSTPVFKISALRGTVTDPVSALALGSSECSMTAI